MLGHSNKNPPERDHFGLDPKELQKLIVVNRSKLEKKELSERFEHLAMSSTPRNGFLRHRYTKKKWGKEKLFIINSSCFSNNPMFFQVPFISSPVAPAAFLAWNTPIGGGPGTDPTGGLDFSNCAGFWGQAGYHLKFGRVVLDPPLP